LGIFRTGKFRSGGRVIGCAVAYALLINLFLAGILGAQASLNAHGDAGFAICLTSSDGTPASPADHGASPAAKIHCMLCAVGGALADAAAPTAAVVAPDAVTLAAEPFVAETATVSTRPSSTSPRGPPQTA
jgi:hypothetical protein